MALRRNVLSTTLVVLSLLAVALAQSWPLPLHLATHLTGDPGGDTGVYVWNTWVFSHELVHEGRWPMSTTSAFGLTGPVDLSLHNYTVFPNLLALPLQPWLGVVAAFNVVYLVNVALAGLGMFLLARRIGRPSGVGTMEAWLAAVAFACSPFLVARATAHFSLVAAAPLPFFAVAFDRLLQSHRRRDAVMAGACMAWAGYCDVYFVVYCLLIGITLSTCRFVSFRIDRRAPFWSWQPAFDAPILLLIAAMGAIGVASGGQLRIGALVISMRTFYTPVLLLTILVVTRTWWTLRPIVRREPPAVRPLVAPVALAGLAAAILLAPVLTALAIRAIDGRFVQVPVLWRSSAPGVDLVSLVLPNPNHPLAPDRLVDWVAAQPGRYEENVASIPWVVLAVVLIGWRRAGYRMDRSWTLMLLLFGSLALGPFVRIFGLNTHVPTPWTLLRYLPVIGEARMPPRFAVVVIMAAAVLFAGALAAMRRHWPARARTLLALVSGLLAFELWPAPRPLSEATVPAFFDEVAADSRPLRVLTVPFGIRDGLSSVGDFRASTLFHQTVHGKPIVGGYLSRVSESRKERTLADPVAAALAAKSEGRVLEESRRAIARREGREFVRRAAIGWVVIDESRASVALRDLAIDALGLTFIKRSGSFALYETAAAQTAASVR